MNISVRPLIITLAILASLLFVSAIVWSGVLSLSGDGVLPPLVSAAVIAIGGVLSTNLGAVLGTTLVPPSAPVRNASPTYLSLRSSFAVNKAPLDAGAVEPREKVQILACWVYIISLVLAVGFWIATQVMQTQPVAPLEELATTFIGVVVGGVTVLLGNQ